MTENEKKPNLYRVIFRRKEYLGTAEQLHAKVVAPDFVTAMKLACDALNLDPANLEGAVVSLIHDNTEIRDGKVFDFARRTRAFGERSGWTWKNILPRKDPTGPRKNPLL